MRIFTVFIGVLLTTLMMDTAGFAQYSEAWDARAEKDVAGVVTNLAISHGDNGVAFVVRCGHICEVYLYARDFIFSERPYVDVKFNDGPVKRFSVNTGEGSDYLFFKKPLALMQAINNNGGFMTVEYSPYQRKPRMTKFGVWHLPPELRVRIPKG